MTETSDSKNNSGTSELAPYPGSRQIPRWQLGNLPDAPDFTGRNWLAMFGPGFLMGALAIGGGEWLMGPMITAKFGAGLLWLALLALLCQLIYNIEISRYTLYTGEPIFTGKFRTPPGPMFWVWIYLLLDFGMFFLTWPAVPPHRWSHSGVGNYLTRNRTRCCCGSSVSAFSCCP